MASTVFEDKETMVPAAWANDVNTLVYTVLGAPTNAGDVRRAIGLGDMAVQNSHLVNIQGGYMDGVVIGSREPVPGTFRSLSMIELTPTLPQHAISKQYFDNSMADIVRTLLSVGGGSTIVDGKVNRTGDSMTGPLYLYADPSLGLEAAPKQYVDNTITTRLATYAKLASPAFTGTPTTATTGPYGDHSTLLANTAYVNNALWDAVNINLTGGTRTLLPIEYGTLTIKLTGTLTSDAVVVLPSFGRWEILNACTMGPYSVTISNGGAATVVPPLGLITVMSDASLGVLQTGSGTLVVNSFNGRSGVVTLQATDVTGVGGALLASPALTGTPTAPTPSVGDSSTNIATTAFVGTAISSAVAPLISPVAQKLFYGGPVSGANAAPTFRALAATDLPLATTTAVGAVSVGSGLAVDGAGKLSVTYAYTLPIASAGTLGGVRIGSGLSIDGFGVLSVSYSYTLPIATSTVLGGVKIGSGLTIDGSGTLSVDASGVNPYVNVTAQSAATPATAANGSIAIGGSTNTNTAIDAVVIGSNASTTGNNSVSIGQSANTTAVDTIAIGPSAVASATGAIAIGRSSSATVANTFSVGNPSLLRKVINVAGGDGANEAITWDQIATTSTRGLVQVGAGLQIDSSGVLSTISGGSAVTSVNGKTDAVVIAGGLGVNVDASGSNIVLTATVVGVNSKVGNVAITGVNGVIVDNSGSGIALSAQVAEAPLDSAFYARKDGTWVEFVPSTTAVTKVTGSSTTSSVNLVRDDGSGSSHIAILKDLAAGSNITLTDDGAGKLTIAAAVLSSVSSVNGVTPVSGNVTLTATNVNALARDGSNAASGNINLGGFKATNAADPTNPQDLVTLAFLGTLTIDPGVI